jgi:hypothetical protein
VGFYFSVYLSLFVDFVHLQDCQRAVLHVVNPHVDELKATATSTSTVGVINSTLVAPASISN